MELITLTLFALGSTFLHSCFETPDWEDEWIVQPTELIESEKSGAHVELLLREGEEDEQRVQEGQAQGQEVLV